LPEEAAAEGKPDIRAGTCSCEYNIINISICFFKEGP